MVLTCKINSSVRGHEELLKSAVNLKSTLKQYDHFFLIPLRVLKPNSVQSGADSYIFDNDRCKNSYGSQGVRKQRCVKYSLSLKDNIGQNSLYCSSAQ